MRYIKMEFKDGKFTHREEGSNDAIDYMLYKLFKHIDFKPAKVSPSRVYLELTDDVNIDIDGEDVNGLVTLYCEERAKELGLDLDAYILAIESYEFGIRKRP